MHISITSKPISIDRCVAKVRQPHRGGLTIFVGQVRNHNNGRTIKNLHYESYRNMALKVLTTIAIEAMGNANDIGVAIEHRTGHLDVGDDAVVIAVAAPHRDESFIICRTIIEELKKNAPIWKKEFDTEGGVWLGVGP